MTGSKGRAGQRVHTPESQFPAGRPRRPKHLSPVAADKWREMVRLLTRRKTLTAADGPALEVFCEIYARWRLLVEDIQNEGVNVDDESVTKSGQVITHRVVNPSCKAAAQLEGQMRLWLSSAFAQTPMSREKATPASRGKTKPHEWPEGTMGYYDQQMKEQQQSDPAPESESFQKVISDEELNDYSG